MGRAPEPHERETELVQVRRQPGRVEILGHHPRTRSERRLDPRLGVQPRLDGPLREQAGGEHHGGVRGVRAARDRGDHDRTVADDAVVERDRLLGPRFHGLLEIDPDLRVPALLEEPTDLGRVGVGLEPVAERLDERAPHARERDAILWPLRSGDRGFDRGEVELEDLGEHGLRVAVAAKQTLLLRVALDEVDPVAATRELQVAQRLAVDGPERGGGTVLRAHVRQRGAIGELEGRTTVPEELDEPPDDAVLAEHLGEREDQVGAVVPAGRCSVTRTPTTSGVGRNIGWPSIAASASIPPTPHPRTPSPFTIVVGIRPDERVRERHAVLHHDHPPEVLEVHLMADPRAGRDHAMPSKACCAHRSNAYRSPLRRYSHSMFASYASGERNRSTCTE